MKRSLLALFLLAASLVLAANADAKDESACERGREALAAARDVYGFPGAVLGMTLADGTECVVAVGLADVESGVPMQPGSRMLAASIGKTFVAGVVLRLVHDGVLGLNDPVARWLGDEPYFPRIPNSGSMTIRHLLSHSAGLPDHVHGEKFAQELAALVGTDHSFCPEELVAFILDQPPLFESGTDFGYSDTGYVLLGMVIERASGHDYFDLAREYFIEPLELSLSEPSNSRSLPGLVPGYVAADNPLNLPVKSIGPDGRMTWNPATEWTGGGYVSNPRDLARWVRAEFSGRAAPYPYLDELIEGAPASVRERSDRYGLGVSKVDSPYGGMLGHYGWIPGYVSAAFYLPGRDVAYALQINSDVNMTGPEGSFSKILELVLAALFPAAPDSP